MIEGYKPTHWKIEPPAPPLLRDRVRRWPWRLWGAVVLIVLGWGLLVLWFIGSGMVALIASLFVSSGAFYNRARFGRASLDVRDLMDLPPVVPQYPVEVIYSRCLVVYGRDVGVASLIDGTLQFQGRKSRFAFARPHLYSAIPTYGARECRYELTYVHDGAVAKVVIACFDAVPGLDGRFQKAFRAATTEFATAKPDPVPSAVLPPAVPEPGFSRPIWKSGPVLCVGLLLSVATMMIAVTLGFAAVPIWLFFGGLFGAGMAVLLLIQRHYELRLLAQMRNAGALATPAEGGEIDRAEATLRTNA